MKKSLVLILMLLPLCASAAIIYTYGQWVDKARGVTQDLSGWRSMWFGGNASYADFTFPAGKVLSRYEDGHFASTQAQWL